MKLGEQTPAPYRRAHLIVLTLYYIGAVATLFWSITNGEGYLIAMAVAALVLPLVPKLLYKIFHWRQVCLFEIIFNCFAFTAVPFASVLGGYDMVPYLDKILHCLSGFLFAVVGVILYYYCKEDRRRVPGDALTASLFAAMFAMSTAVLWEIYEYILSLFGPDPQLVATTGVHDTMQDMLVCTVGGILTAISCYRYLKGAKPGLMMRLFESFYDINMASSK